MGDRAFRSMFKTHQLTDPGVVARVRGVGALLRQQFIEPVFRMVDLSGRHINPDVAQPRSADQDKKCRDGVFSRGEIRQTIADQLISRKSFEAHKRSIAAQRAEGPAAVSHGRVQRSLSLPGSLDQGCLCARVASKRHATPPFQARKACVFTPLRTVDHDPTSSTVGVRPKLSPRELRT